MPLKQSDFVGIGAFLNDLTYGEVHLMAMGLYSGFTAVRPTRRTTPRGPGYPNEGDDWYFGGAYVVGYVLKVLAVAALAVLGVLP